MGSVPNGESSPSARLTRALLLFQINLKKKKKDISVPSVSETTLLVLENPHSGFLLYTHYAASHVPLHYWLYVLENGNHNTW